MNQKNKKRGAISPRVALCGLIATILVVTLLILREESTQNGFTKSDGVTSPMEILSAGGDTMTWGNAVVENHLDFAVGCRISNLQGDKIAVEIRELIAGIDQEVNPPIERGGNWLRRTSLHLENSGTVDTSRVVILNGLEHEDFLCEVVEFPGGVTRFKIMVERKRVEIDFSLDQPASGCIAPREVGIFRPTGIEIAAEEEPLSYTATISPDGETTVTISIP